MVQSCNLITSRQTSCRGFQVSISSPLLHTFSGHTFVDLENALWYALLGNRFGYGERYGFLASVVFFSPPSIFWEDGLRVWIESLAFLVNFEAQKCIMNLIGSHLFPYVSFLVAS